MWVLLLIYGAIGIVVGGLLLFIFKRFHLNKQLIMQSVSCLQVMSTVGSLHLRWTDSSQSLMNCAE
jgi:hypothetical protein